MFMLQSRGSVLTGERFHRKMDAIAAADEKAKMLNENHGTKHGEAALASGWRRPHVVIVTRGRCEQNAVYSTNS